MKTYYFLGIGGIGMSAIARYFNHMGFKIYGYDRTKTPLTIELENEGMKISYDDDIESLPNNIDMFIYTPAIPSDNKILMYCKENGIKLYKRSEILGEITKGRKCIAIAGTHGKTTCTSMVAHILHNSNIGCSAFLGGISKNFNSNYVFNKASEYIVVEADEYDRSFLHLNPMISAITAVDADHLDIYGSKKQLQSSFLEFAKKTQGSLFVKNGLEINFKENVSIDVLDYTIRGFDADYYATNIRNYNGAYYFDLRTPDKVLYDLCLNYGGLHNVENSVLAIAICLTLGVSEEELRKSLASFSGASRRFDFRIKRKDFIYIDDYAHHPNEIKALVESLRDMFPNKRITGVFQPHLYSRTKDFADSFARELEKLDEVVLLDIYPAREKEIVGINSKMLLHKINKMDKYYSLKETLPDLLEALYPQVLVTMGAGDISEIVPIIETRFRDE